MSFDEDGQTEGGYCKINKANYYKEQHPTCILLFIPIIVNNVGSCSTTLVVVQHCNCISDSLPSFGCNSFESRFNSQLYY